MTPTSLSHIHNLLSITEVTLGQLIRNRLNPGQDYCDTSAIPQESEISKRRYKNLHQWRRNERDTTLGALFSRFFSITGDNHTVLHHEMVAPEATRSMLRQPEDYFKKHCEHETTKQWIMKRLEHGSIFMVVALVTVKEPRVLRHHERAMAGRIEGEEPNTDALTSGAASPGSAQALNAEVEATIGFHRGTGMLVESDEEQIIAMEYRKIRYRDETLFLESNNYPISFGQNDSSEIIYQLLIFLLFLLFILIITLYIT